MIPLHMRKALGWEDDSDIQITQAEDSLILQAKTKDRCCLCAGETELHRFFGRCLCRDCIHSIKDSQL